MTKLSSNLEVPASSVHPRCANAHNCYGRTLGQRLDKVSNSRGALLLKTGNFKVILKIPGGHIAMFSARA